MPDGMGAESQSTGSTHFSDAVQSQLPFSVEDVGIAAVCRAKINEFVQIVIAARQTQNRSHHQSGADGSNGQAVGLGGAIDHVGSLSSGGSFDEFHCYSWLAGNVFLQKANQRSGL